MRLPVRIHEAAEAEIQEAADFYDIESLGLSAEFAGEIEITRPPLPTRSDGRSTGHRDCSGRGSGATAA